MSKKRFGIDIAQTIRVAKAMKEYEGDAEKAINEVFWNECGPLVYDTIMNLLPVSGRNWKGKKPAAKSSAPFMQINENLSVTIKTKSAYNYLYFPDDGTNTRRHAGEQYFMFKGVNSQYGEMIDRCIAKLTENFN